MTEEPDQQQSRGYSDGSIVGYNMLAFAIYTIAGLSAGSSGIGAGFLLACLHFGACIVMAIIKKRWSWALAGISIILIGMGTCVYGVITSGNL